MDTQKLLSDLLLNMNAGLPEKLLLDLGALAAPAPTEDQIRSEQTRDRNANPHNEPYHNKPPRRGRDEIIWDLRYRHAHEALNARKRTVEQLENRVGSGRR